MCLYFTRKASAHLLASLLLLPLSAHVFARAAGDTVADIVDSRASSLIKTFKQFHQNPELGFQEFETAAVIASHLESLGDPLRTGVGGSGVVSVIENGPGPVVLFRSDMDALPLQELADIDYASKKTTRDLEGVVVPVMLACGHDGLAAWLLGVATVMLTM
mgnify:CR=1 FL=1